MRDEALAAASCLSELGVGAASISNPVTQQQTTTPAISTTMAQLDRLRKLFDEQERMFTTVPGLADYITQLGPSRGSTCAIRLCFLRGNHFSTDQYSGTHLEFIDAESANVFDDARRMLLAIPLMQSRSEICRLTVWERTDLSYFTPGNVYEIRHVFNLNVYNGMPQGSATRICAEGWVQVEQTQLTNDEPTPATPLSAGTSTAGAEATPSAAATGRAASKYCDNLTSALPVAASIDPAEKAARLPTPGQAEHAVSRTPKRNRPTDSTDAPPKHHCPER